MLIGVLLTLSVLINLFSAIVLLIILGGIIRIAGDISSIQEYQSKEHAKIIAEDMEKKGYVITEKGKELLNLNTGKY